MKMTVLRWCLLLALTAVGGFALPMPLVANTGPALPTVQTPAPLTPPPPAMTADDDFSDADFAQADQPELGAKTGGSALGLVLFVLLVVLIVLLILYLIENGTL